MGNRCITIAKWFLSLSSLYLAQTGCAQTIENVKNTFENGKIIVTYDLKADPAASFTVELYGSHNNFNVPVQLVQGDIGKDIKPGLQKRVVWDVKNALKNFKGELTVELHAEPSILPWAITYPSSTAGLKRGKTSTILWQGGKYSQEINLELYQGTNRIEAITTTAIGNSKKYDWALPAKMKTGSGYSIKLSSGKEGTSSATFKIGRKIPLAFIIAPAAIASYFIVDQAIKAGKKDKGPVNPPASDDLEAAPGPEN